MTNHVLVVDDDEAMLILLRLMLSRAGYTVHTARNGYEALDMLAELTPDLFLVDVMMPEMNGIELCEHIRADPATCETPVIFLSAHGDRYLIEKGFLAGATDYLPKPVTHSVLVSKVNSALLKSEAQAK